MDFFPDGQLLDVFLSDVLGPGLLAAAVLGLTWLLFGRRAAPLGAVLALAAGFALGNGLRGAVPFLPERLGWPCLFWTTLGALVLGLVNRLPGWFVVPTTALLAAWLLVSSADRSIGWWTIPLFAVVVALEWRIAAEQAWRQPWLVPLYLAVVFLAGAGVLLFAHCGRLFDVAVILASSLTAIATLAGIGRLEVGSVVPGAIVALCGLLLAGLSETYSEVPGLSFFLVALAPLLLSVTLPQARCKRATTIQPGFRTNHLV